MAQPDNQVDSFRIKNLELALSLKHRLISKLSLLSARDKPALV
jgi:hypothetical protein